MPTRIGTGYRGEAGRATDFRATACLAPKTDKVKGFRYRPVVTSILAGWLSADVQQVRIGLPAGGRWIRTFGSARDRTTVGVCKFHAPHATARTAAILKRWSGLTRLPLEERRGFTRKHQRRAP